MQNEFAYWQEFDPHATKAFQVLSNAEGQAIARKMGLGDATTAKICLDCHSDNVPEAMRGEKFQVSDGIGCEACHGGSEQWISAHADKGVGHADNLAKGLYPTEDPVKRAELCLSCHMGTKDRMITHKIMGAGHPRLSFELDTFTWLNPHYQIDEDYIKRKGEFNGLRDWGVGQGVAAANLLDQLTDERAGWHGIFPELVLFDCHACHKPMSANKWGPRQGTGLGPGVVRLNDANLVMFRHVLAGVDKGAASRIGEQTKALHRATTQSRDATFAAARALESSIRAELPKVAQAPWSADTLGGILASLVADADRGEFRDFAAAEQAAMAAQSVVVAFQNAGTLDEQRSKTLQSRVDALYSTVENEDNYAMGRFVGALKDLRSAAP
ncbi:MAG TPA: multiheme c-type cytochrome [Xanthomonadales bacterium]|nr:multiheme c-type cytochrome [Xanthomonadales bacterium]